MPINKFLYHVAKPIYSNKRWLPFFIVQLAKIKLNSLIGANQAKNLFV